eukprot:3315632-Amphidinium_carterae.1
MPPIDCNRTPCRHDGYPRGGLQLRFGQEFTHITMTFQSKFEPFYNTTQSTNERFAPLKFDFPLKNLTNLFATVCLLPLQPANLRVSDRWICHLFVQVKTVST